MNIERFKLEINQIVRNYGWRCSEDSLERICFKLRRIRKNSKHKIGCLEFQNNGMVCFVKTRLMKYEPWQFRGLGRAVNGDWLIKAVRSRINRTNQFISPIDGNAAKVFYRAGVRDVRSRTK